ncbi:MAG TPA: tetratricopeptide repeat protein, partial [Crocinitomicaceae bacterium]|nr:tetratricopeptide repeat protein [Crocinitomicaceae bacterium]
MKSLLLITIIFIGAFYSSAQKNDSVLALKHFALFQDFEYEDSLKARVHVDSGLYYAKRSNSPHLIGLAYQFQGWFLQDKSFYQQSNDAFFKALDFFERANDQQGVANMYGNIGNSYLDINDFENSLDYQFLSLKENEKILENEVSGDAYDNAVEGKTYALHNIGSIYAEVKLYDLALKYEYESLEFEKKVGHKIDVAISYNTLGAIYKAKSIRDSAEYYFKQAIEIYKIESYPYGYSSSLQTYASMDSTSLSKGKRMKMFAEALRIRKEIGDVDFEARVYLDIIDVGMNALSADSVQTVLVHVHDIIEENGFVDLKWKYYQLKAKHLSRMGNYKEAFETIKKSIDYEEKTNNKKKQQDLATKEIR